MESVPLGCLVVLLGVTAGLSATPRAASATQWHSRAALTSNGASPFRGGRPRHGGGWPFGVEQTQDIAGGQPATNSSDPALWSLWFGESQVSKWPWVAMLHAELPEPFTSFTFCGGSLINSRHVLTAAHCYDESSMPREYLRVRLGEFDSRTSTDGNHTDYQVEAVLKHPSYRDGIANHDIALWRLAKEVKFSAGVCTIPLPDGPTGDLAGSHLTIAGWGVTHNGSKTASPVLMELNVTTISEDECFNKYARVYPTLVSKNVTARTPFPGGFMKEKKICTESKKEGQSTCDGDSGSPLVEYGKFRVVGVNSVGRGICGIRKSPQIFSRVSAYLDWIQKSVNITGVKTQHCQNTFIHAG